MNMDRETFLRLTQEAGFHAPVGADGYMGLAYDNRREGETGGSLEKLVELAQEFEREQRLKRKERSFMSLIINEANLLAQMKLKMNAEMLAAAEPVIRKAVEECEKEMRTRLGAMLIGMIEQSFSVTRAGSVIEIRLNQERLKP